MWARDQALLLRSPKLFRAASPNPLLVRKGGFEPSVPRLKPVRCLLRYFLVARVRFELTHVGS